MDYDPVKHSGRLNRLDSQCYRGIQWVHWIMTIDQRQTGWLGETHHLRFREVLCHAMARGNLICPAYCLMPDHGHFLFGGLEENSDQKKAIKMLRREWNLILKDAAPACRLQVQAFDHVLTESERERGTFENVAGYILENPQRGRLVDSYKDWPYLGVMVVGYPRIDPRDDEFYPLFWRIYDRLINPEQA
jgi:REP element-mobilizing transposase RayT